MRVPEVLQKYQDFLLTQGRKTTREREVIVYQICMTQGPFDSVQLCDRLSKVGERAASQPIFCLPNTARP